MSREDKISRQVREIAKLHHFHLRMLSKLASDSVGLSSGEEIFRLIGKHLEKLIPGSIIVCIMIDHDKEMLIPKMVTGLGDSINKVTEVLGVHPDKMTFSSRDLDIAGLSTGKLLKIEGGLVELSRELMPAVTCRKLEKLLNINEIFQIGCTWKGILYGGAVIVSTGNSKLDNKEVVETYMNLASIALRQKFTQEALTANEVLYQNLYDYAPDMYFTVLPDGTVKSVNLFGAEYLGYTKDELIGKSVWIVVHPDDLDEVKDQINMILKKKLSFSELEFRKIKKDGSALSVQERIQLFLDNDQNPVEIRIICRDVSEQKKSQDELIDREQQISTILKYSPNPQILEDFREAKIFVNDLKKKGVKDILTYFTKNPDESFACRQKVKIIEVNNSFLELFGTKNITDLIKNVDRIITRQSIQVFIKGLLQLMEGKDSFTGETFYFDLENTKVEAITRWAVVPGHEDNLDMIVVSLEDMTERNRANRQLQILSSAVDHSPVSVVITDPDGNIQYVNPKFTEITGYSSAEAVNKNSNKIKSVLVPEESYENLINTILKGKVWSGEFRNQKKNGEYYWELASISAVRDAKGIINQIVAIKEDISQRKETEKELIQAKMQAEESDKLKTAFLANMSHEIRTPMNAIVGFSELLKDPNIQEEQKREFYNIITSSCDTLSALIDDIIDIAKIESGQSNINFSECMISEILQELYTLTKEEIRKNNPAVELRLNSQVDKKMMLLTDGFRIKQIFLNLLGNALKFTKTGYVEFGCKMPDEDTIEFFVIDSGIGIPKKMQNLIFDRFRQLDSSTSRTYGGTGLGLTISKNLVELLGGKIWVESKKGKGTSFFFTFPVRPKHPYEPEESAVLKPDIVLKDWTSKTILIVEDNAANFEFFKAVLSRSGAKILEATSGKEAIDLVKSDQLIDLILMDIQMPDMTGYETTKVIRKLNIKIPIIAQTAYAMPHDKEKSLEAGCDNYLAKPVRPNELLAMVTKHL